MLTSDRVPRDLDRLTARLRDRFESGLVAEIEPPDIATRLAVLRKHAAHTDMPVPTEEAIELIASRVTTNLRALEGALIRVVAFASLRSRPADDDLTADVLDQLGTPAAGEVAAGPVTVDSVQETTCRRLRNRRETSSSLPASEARLAWPRQVAMYLAREHTDESLPSIGRKFGGRGHTTVLHACRRTEQRLTSDPEASTLVDRPVEGPQARARRPSD